MISDMTIDDAAMRAALVQVIEKQIPFAVSRGTNDAAAQVVKALSAHANEVFDRPTPFAVNAWTYRPGNKADPTATVMRKPSAASRDFLAVQILGGARGATGQEGALRMRAPVASPWVAAIPADGAALDQYGNWSSGERSRVFAQLRLFRDSAQWETETSRAKRIKRQGAEYFVGSRNLPPGIYRRGGPRNRDAIPVLMFVDKVPQYQPRFRFEDVGRETFDKFAPDMIARALREALASAR